MKPEYNEYQDEILTTWTPVADVWASIQPQFGMELNTAGRTVATLMIPVVIRYRSDIDARWRIQDREKVYQIKGILDIARRHVQLQLNCEEAQ